MDEGITNIMIATFSNKVKYLNPDGLFIMFSTMVAIHTENNYCYRAIITSCIIILLLIIYFFQYIVKPIQYLNKMKDVREGNLSVNIQFKR